MVATAITLIVIDRDFKVDLAGLAATSTFITEVVALSVQKTLKPLSAAVSLPVDSSFDQGG